MAITRYSSEVLEGQKTLSEGSPSGVRAMPLKLSMRVVTRISRARWFRFLRRVFEYQNGSRSDLLSNPFNSRPWLALEFFVLVAQIVAITATLVMAGKENPIWPLRIWVAGYNLGNLLSLPLLYWRFCHSNPTTNGTGTGTDLEQQSCKQESRCSYMMNKSRTFLELFFAIWFVMGNVWVFDPRNGSLNRDPRLHALCILLLAWNAITYSFPFLLFLLLCCCVPSVSKVLGYNMNLASADRGFSDDEISRLAHWRFKQVESKNELANDKSQCCICLAKYRDKEEVRQLPCSHIFHQICVDQWLRIISYCPLCKRELER